MTLAQYLQEWNEACAYAAECFPPYIEPVTPLIWIGVGAFVFWAFHEWRISKGRR